jgi:FAD/FMN-containing dehydrogenase
MENFTRGDPTRDWTVREAMALWQEQTGVDGFNLSYAVLPESFADAVDLLIPELQDRGLYKTEYAPGTLREKLFGDGARLRAPHPAAGARMSQSG